MALHWVALTGTPGVGKTTIARRLRARGFEVVDAAAFAKQSGAIVGEDAARRSGLVDVVRAGRSLAKKFPKDGTLRVLEGHWAHAVPGMDGAIVLRLHPKRLESRLKRRAWSERKVRENVEAELLHIVVSEALHVLPRRAIAELDLTLKSAAEATDQVEWILKDPKRRLTKFEIGTVDWTEELLKWF